MVIFEALADKEVAEDFAQVGILGLIPKFQGTDVVEVSGEFFWEITAKILRADGLLFFQYEF